MSRKSPFTREEKIAAVSLVIDKGRSTLSVANEYGVHDDTIIKWRKQYLTSPEDAFIQAPSSEPLNEAERLSRRIRELENEVDFLKKCQRILPEPRAKIRHDPRTCGETEHQASL